MCFKYFSNQKSVALGNLGPMEDNRTFVGDGEGERVIGCGHKGTFVMGKRSHSSTNYSINKIVRQVIFIIRIISVLIIT